MTVTYIYAAPESDQTAVNVTFTDGTVTLERPVNAVFTDGVYDAAETEARVGQVALGVENKIAVGAVHQPDDIVEE